MLDVAYYRLPESDVYHVIRGRAQSSSSLPDLEKCHGFVMAPFFADTNNQYVVIPPMFASTKKVPKRVKHFKVEWIEMDNKTLYKQNFHDLHDLLEKGIIDKVVLSRRVDCRVDQWSCEPEQLFRKACTMYPHQMTALIVTEATGAWFMSTPEVLLKKNGDRLETMALAGTRKGNMSWKQKEIEEQKIVADYISNTIKPFADDIVIGQPYDTFAAALAHIRTDFSFKLRQDAKVNDVVEALHPTPAVCGMPKDRAMGTIRSHESIDRRYYSGFCGPWNLDEDSALFVSLRCMEIDGNRNFHLYAGGGLLKESDVRSEWMETEYKMDTMRNVLR